MIWYKDSKNKDPYLSLWKRKEWLQPLENPCRTVFPLIITVEPTNACQNSCLYCSRQLMKRKVGFMDLEIMEKVACEAGKHGVSIRHGGFGEPLLHPQIEEFIDICKRNNALTTIFTNCNRLTEKMMSAFIKSGLDEIRFSSSGIAPDEHDRIRKNSNYQEDFDKKLRMAYNIRQQMKAQRPFLTVYTNVIDYNNDDFQDNVKQYKEKYLQYADKIDIDLTMFSRVKSLDHVKPFYEQQTITECYKACLTLFLKVIVHYNGDVFACDIPYDFEEKHFLGNIMDRDFSIEKAYNSPKIQDLRKQLSFDVGHSQFSLCKDCFSNTKKWETKEWLFNE